MNVIFKDVLLWTTCAVTIISCAEDDAYTYSAEPMNNAELKSILRSKGYTFDDEGYLLLDDLVKGTRTLDLSGTGITDLSGLEMLPSLTDLDLSDNGYGPVFDCSMLPAQIKGLTLVGNQIYDFEGLAAGEMVNDELSSTVLRHFDRLYLPETARYNVEDLVPYYLAAGEETDMQMADATGTLAIYTTLRDIPDPYFRDYLQGLYSSIFVGQQMDISRPLSLKDDGVNLYLNGRTSYVNCDSIQSFEGVEYIINHPYRSQPILVYINSTVPVQLSYIMPGAAIKGLGFSSVSTPQGMDLSKATRLASLFWSGDEYVTELDLSHTLVANQPVADFDMLSSNILSLSHCTHLRHIVMPAQCLGYMAQYELNNLPALNAVDMTFMRAVQVIGLSYLGNPDGIVYPSLEYIYNDEDCSLDVPGPKASTLYLTLSEDIYATQAAQDFIRAYKTNISCKTK